MASRRICGELEMIYECCDGQQTSDSLLFNTSRTVGYVEIEIRLTPPLLARRLLILINSHSQLVAKALT